MVWIAPHCTTPDVTKFCRLKVPQASFERLDEQELQTIPWLGQLVALPQLTRVVRSCGDIRPGRFLMQLPAGCELEFNTWGSKTLSESLPHNASLAHLVTLEVECCDSTMSIDFSCLATCPKLRHVKLQSSYVNNFLDWVNLSTLNHVPDRCSVVLDFQDAAMCIGSFDPPAGWSVEPGYSKSFWSKDELIFSRNGSQDCTLNVNY